MRTCTYCPHYAPYLGWDDDLGEIELCACCYGSPYDPKECEENMSNKRHKHQYKFKKRHPDKHWRGNSYLEFTCRTCGEGYALDAITFYTMVMPPWKALGYQHGYY